MFKETLMDYVNQLKPISGIAGEKFPLHDVPETTITVQEHLGHMEEATYSDETRARVLRNIALARELFGLGVFSILTPRSPRGAIALIELFDSSLQKLMDDHAKEVKARSLEAFARGFDLGREINASIYGNPIKFIILPYELSNKEYIYRQNPLVPLIINTQKIIKH